MNDRRSLARLRHDPARLRLDGGWRSCHDAIRWRNTGASCTLRGTLYGTLTRSLSSIGSGRCSAGSGRTHHDRRSCGALRELGLALGFLLLGQDRFEHVAWLGDVGEVDLGLILLLATRTGGPA
jgi:hypothetical protein